MRKLKGTSIDRLWTIGSWYANGNILVYSKSGKEYRIHVDELKKLIKNFEFDVEEKRINSYLINPKNIGGKNGR